MMKQFSLQVVALAALVCAVLGGAHASNVAEIEMIESYMNRLSTAKARFVQTSHDGQQLVGSFYLSRPGRLRFEYDPPVEDFIVADGYLLYFYDSELEEQVNMPLGSSLADFILRQHINFREDVTVTDVQRGGDLLQITLVQKSDPEAGSLTLGFSESPFGLKKWRVNDAQGMMTEVELFYLETGVKLEDKLFRYIDPKHGKVQKFND